MFFCLLLSGALSLFAARPLRIFSLLGLNALAHLLLDAIQIKWANGVHLFAPFSWKALSFSFVWPEHLLIYLLSACGLGILIYGVYYGLKGWGETVLLTVKQKNMIIAVLLLAAYMTFPLLFFSGPEKENNHFVATLRGVEERAGKYIEFDRVHFSSHDKVVNVFSGEKLSLQGALPDEDALISIQGNFLNNETIKVSSLHVHSRFRDLASMIGLAGILFVWLLSFLRQRTETGIESIEMN